MKTILLFGAGKSATCLIDYLLVHAPSNDWRLLVADSNLTLAQSKVAGAANAAAVATDIKDELQRAELINQSDIVISMLPAALHILVARTCLALGKHLLTASYADNDIRQMSEEIKEKGLLFLCEMGLDPGIDHMSAMRIIHAIQNKGGKITSFHSHCGGLVAPESDNNPWHYKISWNPRNVVLAGKSGAVYKKSGKVATLPYEQLFVDNPAVNIPGLGAYAWYPNRDSLAYSVLYHLQDTETFVRTTLRHPDFCKGWSKIVELGLTDDQVVLDTDTMTYAGLTRLHFRQKADITPETALQREMLEYLGLYDDRLIGNGSQTAAAVLQGLLETKLALHPADKDMIIMLHEFEYLQDGVHKKTDSCLVVKGEDSLRTAMAKTVGLPLAIAVKLILQNTISLTGLHIPVLAEIYDPVLEELAKEGISFMEMVKV